MAALQIFINSVDKTNIVNWSTINLDQTARSQVDTLSFTVSYYGTRTYIPQVNDEVEIFRSGIKIFGGDILNITLDKDGYNRRVYTVMVKDYTHRMDRFLVAETYQGEPVRNIISDILNKYPNRLLRIPLATFDPLEIWTGGTADTTNYIVGDQARMLTSTSGSTVSMNTFVNRNLAITGFSTSDYIDIDIYVDNHFNLQNCLLVLGDPTLANYFTLNVASMLSDGWNMVHVPMSSFTAVGSPTWSAINQLQLTVKANGSSTVNVTFDNYQAMSKKAFTRNNCFYADQIVNYQAFNYVYVSIALQKMAELFQWQWYLDENKDIHFYESMTEAADFNISDTLGNHIPTTLKMVTIGDQLRNSVFLRGGEYEAAVETEQLGRQADGANKFINLAYKYSNYTLTVGGIAKAVGLDNLNDFTLNQSAKQDNIGFANLNLGDSATRTRQEQEIVASSSARHKHARFFIRKVGAPVDNLQFQIFTDNGSDLPSATAISNITTLAGASVSTTYFEFTIDFVENATNSLLLARETKFHIVITRSGAVDAANYYQFDSGKRGSYQGLSHAYNGGSWISNTADFYFIELVDYDVLYNYNEKVLKFQTAPAAASVIAWTATPLKPIIVQYKDNSSITTYGEFQYKIIDKTIRDLDGARQRCQQELQKNSYPLQQGSFRTRKDGLRAGQSINVNSVILGINRNYTIKSINMRCYGPSKDDPQIMYNVSLSSN